MSQPRPPNLLFVLADQHRADWLGSAGLASLRTPNLDQLAARGVRFTRAYCGSPLCAPSRACLATGRDYDRCGVPDHSVDFPAGMPTFYQHLRAAGYRVGGCGKFDLHKASPTWGVAGTHRLAEWGFTDGRDCGGKWDAVHAYLHHGAAQEPYFATLEARGLAATYAASMQHRESYEPGGTNPLPDDLYCDNWIAGQARALIEAFPRAQPWFLQVNFAGPHEPLDITTAMRARVAGREFPPPATPGDCRSPAEHQEIRRHYAAMVENIDRAVGELLPSVEARGELDRTLVVFASDHGEMLGDHGRWEKQVPFEAAVRVPLIVAGPNVAGGATCATAASLTDLGVTFLEVSGAQPLPEADGESLAPWFAEPERKARRIVRCGLGPWRMATDGVHKLVTGFVSETSPAAESAQLFRVDGTEAAGVLENEHGIGTALAAALQGGRNA